ncbi:RNA polymerase sigma factor [Faecalibacter rhinopitheci]|uniref:Sigma-70 family RNA polymerase sigma factor n=1 Tax=Faecalibacter rhinopitheci TaxID=2779678 RepID=A0A8J7FNE2_9FLAO|nr:sigma-70 family RNA polymerase sigma factor [Faecalibacter rhinopitheci]MBF0597652.1 sigma-70 family RNA polymerase sigma factor [Faecalibacter rhinopitheci]MBQ0147052.1 sigma-70 family RNA polymerase sigma factor [Candidatus Onthonaster equi]
MDLQHIIQACKKNDTKAQRLLYEKYDSRFFAVCKRYFVNVHEAEDALVKGFLKIFQHINSFSNEGNFEGWMHRIIVNECLMEIRKNKTFLLNIEDHNKSLHADNIINEDNGDIMQLLNLLPEGCRIVFVLYVIEGYKHKEIAEQLSISEGTSKSQLNLAKTKLKDLFNKYPNLKANLL